MPKKTTTPALQDADTVAGETIIINGIPQERSRIDQMYGAEAESVWAKGIAEKKSLEGRAVIRAAIKNKVADPESLLGTTADGAQLAVAALLVDVIALDDAKSFAEYKAARLALMSELVGKDRETGKAVNVAALAQGVIGKIKSGEAMLTAVIKGVPAVLAEIMERSTNVVDIIAAASK